MLDAGYPPWQLNNGGAAGGAAFRLSTRLKGPATIKALGNYSAPDGYGMITVYNGGKAYQMRRLYLDDMLIHGADVAEGGILAHLQQPTQWTKVRVDHCTDYGIKLRGQQADLRNTDIVACDRTVVIDDAQFLYFNGFNVEQSRVAVDHRTGASSHWLGVHIEASTLGAIGWREADADADADA